MSDGEHVTFIAKVFNRKDSPNDERKVVSFDRYLGKRDDGTANYDKCTALVYESGEIVPLAKYVWLKPHRGAKGTQAFNIYSVKPKDEEPPSPARNDFMDSEDDLDF